MREFHQSEEFQDNFRRATRHYLREVDQAKERARKTEAARHKHKSDTWQADLAEALERRAWDRVGRAEGRIIALIRSLSDGRPVPAVEVFNDSSDPVGSYPAVEALGMIFALIGKEENFVVRPAWMSVKVGRSSRGGNDREVAEFATTSEASGRASNR